MWRHYREELGLHNSREWSKGRVQDVETAAQIYKELKQRLSGTTKLYQSDRGPFVNITRRWGRWN